MIRIDLHTHSSASPDGGITAENYRNMLESGGLHYVAITDHNRIDFAVKLQEEMGERVIVGEEIKTDAGEIIGLYLKEVVPSHLSLQETVARIKTQGGIVYIPHPFEKIRSGVSEKNLEEITGDIDIIESVNGRAFTENHTKHVQEFAAAHGIAPCASSDAHGMYGWGNTFTSIAEAPTSDSLPKLLLSSAITYRKPSLRVLLYPKYNRARKLFS